MLWCGAEDDDPCEGISTDDEDGDQDFIIDPAIRENDGGDPGDHREGDEGQECPEDVFFGGHALGLSGLAGTGTHAFESCGEWVAWEDSDIGAFPHLGSGVDVASESGGVHRAEGDLEAWFFLVGVIHHEPVGFGAQEGN